MGRIDRTRDGVAAEHAHAADRFAREIIDILTVSAVRSRRLMGRPFGRWGTWSAIPFLGDTSAAIPERALCRLRRAPCPLCRCGTNARCAVARCARRDSLLGVVPPNARRARWFRADVVRACGWQPRTAGQRAEHAHAADRFARKIVGFLALCAVRSRRLMGRPLDGSSYSS